MAPNPIVVTKANQLFPDLNFNFMTWIEGSSVPALFCGICLPLLLYRFTGLDSQIKNQSSNDDNNNDITSHAKSELDLMGPMSRKEWVKKKII